MSPTFNSLLDDGWGVTNYGPINERRHYLPKIKRHIQNAIRKGQRVKCHIDDTNGNFILAQRSKTLSDYFKK